MSLLANELRKSNSFDWLNDLDRCVNDLLSLSELDSINKARCQKHFEDIVIYQIKKLFPQRYGSYCPVSYTHLDVYKRQKSTFVIPI